MTDLFQKSSSNKKKEAFIVTMKHWETFKRKVEELIAGGLTPAEAYEKAKISAMKGEF